jgi:hypothetical protein
MVLQQRTDDPTALCTHPLLNDGVQAILHAQGIFQLPVVQPDADYPPARRKTPLGNVIEIHRLVRAVEPAHADVHDGRHQPRTIVSRHGKPLRVQLKCRLAQWKSDVST